MGNTSKNRTKSVPDASNSTTSWHEILCRSPRFTWTNLYCELDFQLSCAYFTNKRWIISQIPASHSVRSRTPAPLQCIGLLPAAWAYRDADLRKQKHIRGLYSCFGVSVDVAPRQWRHWQPMKLLQSWLLHPKFDFRFIFTVLVLHYLS